MSPPARPWIGLVIMLAAAPALGGTTDPAADAKLAAQRGFRAALEARDEVGHRSFTSTIVYRYPDRAIATIPPADFVSIDRGVLVVRDGVALRTCDTAAWLRALGKDLNGPLRDLWAIEAGPPGTRKPPPDFERAADRLGTSLVLDLLRLPDKVSMAIILAQRYDLGAEVAPGFSCRMSSATDVTRSALTGFPDRISLRAPLGRIEAEFRVTQFEPLENVPDSALALPPGVDLAKAEHIEPTPGFREEVLRDVVTAALDAAADSASRDPRFFGRDAALEQALTSTYAALMRALLPDARLRDLARRLVRADEEGVRDALRGTSGAGRARAITGLREGFRESCRRQLHEPVTALVYAAEQALPADGARACPDDVRRKLLGISGGAALAAFERAVVSPLEAEAAKELEVIAAAGAPAAEKKGGGRP